MSEKNKEEGTELLDLNESNNKPEEEKGEKNKSCPPIHAVLVSSIVIGVIIFGTIFIRNTYIECKEMNSQKEQVVKVKNPEPKIEEKPFVPVPIISYGQNRALHKVDTVDDLYKEAGEYIISLVKKNPKLRIGLASGGTPKGLYAYLIEQYEKGRVTFRECTFYSLDEFCGIHKDHTQSYDHYMRRFFLYRINAKEENLFLLNGEGELTDDVSKFQKYADDYNKMLAEKPVDVQIISFGGNGHFGFNEKGTPFDSQVHIVKLDDKLRQEKSKLFDNDLSKTPYYSITQGIKTVLDAKEVVVIANGKGKGEGIKSLLGNTPTTDSPLSALIEHKGKVNVFADKDACHLLGN